MIGIILIAVTAGFSLMFFKTAGKSPEYAYIRVNNQLINTISLDDINPPYEIEIEGKFKVKLKVSSQGVEFTKSHCEDQLCIHSGLITAGESAACLPAGVSVTVSGKNNTVDAIAG